MEALREHLEHPVGRGLIGGHAGVAGGALCGDVATMTVRVEGDRVATGWEASGCGATFAACSAVACLAAGGDALDAGRVSVARVSQELGGLSPGKLHAAELACDAFHSALGAAVRADAALAERAGAVAVAMSGGVDSAVAALLAGEGAFGVTVELWRDPDNDESASCCSASAVRAARAMAHGLGMPHFTLDLREEFRAGVVDLWLADHAAGLTPNPCVRCNGHVRLDAMLDFAERLGARTLATGHYARVTEDGRLRAAADPAKDQAYMLAATAPGTVARLRFPLGELGKGRVRELAAQAGLAVADKADSQDLCFLAGVGRAGFLAKHGAAEPPGDIVRDGEVVGRHAGQSGFTVGQRRGIRVPSEDPLYVLRKDGDTVTVGPREQLATREVRVRDLVLSGEPDAVRLRYRSPTVGCRVDGSVLRLSEPFAGAAPGQVAVLYSGDAVVGHGVIV